MRRFIDRDPLTGTEHWVDYDDSEDVFRFTQAVDHQPLADVNREQFNMYEPGDRWGLGQKVASIPMPLWHLLKSLGILDDKKKLAAWLNDPSHAHFRTFPGRV